MKEHDYRYSSVVYGSGINTLLFSFVTGSPIIIEKDQPIFYFDTIEGDFSFLGFTSTENDLAEVYNRLYFLLSMSGLLLNPIPVQNIRHENNSLVYTTGGNKRITIKFDNLIKIEEEEETCDVYDWFAVKSGTQHEYNELTDNTDDFVHKLNFHQSLRKNVRNAKDVVSISRMNSKQLTNVDYSETMVRFKTIAMMKDAGIKGRSNGTSKSGYKLHYAIKLEHMYREAIPRKKYKLSLRELLEHKVKKGAMWNLTKNLFIPKTPSI